MTIHLIAAGKLENPNQWPKLWHHCYNIWESSPYEIKLWGNRDIDNLLKEDDEEFFNILNTLPPSYKWDYVRYVILEKFGGAYFDMDIEIVDGSFLQKLNPNKFYFMEGTLGSFLENSIMISVANKISYSDILYRLKKYIQGRILDSLEDCTNFNVLKYVGAYALSDWFFRYSHQFSRPIQYEILSQYQFGNTTNEIAYTRHHQTSAWN